MKLWEYMWFQRLIIFLRRWNWFDVYIYGKSLNLEDFVRNPAEVFRDTYFPFIIKGVKTYSIINLRLGYIRYKTSDNIPNSWSVPMGEHKLVWNAGRWVIADLRMFNKWWTKYCNAMFFFQFALSFKYCIPIPYVSLNFRIGAKRYFQFGLGWGYESINNGSAVLCAKLRYVNQVTSNENEWNPSDVVGYYEGTI